MCKTIIHVPRRFVSHEWGGTETVITEISRQQQRAGYLPKIMTSMALARDRNECIAGIPVQRYPYCYPFLGLSQAEIEALDKKGGNLLSLSLFTALLREPDVRLYHAHALKRLGGSAATAARWRNKPFVVSLHGGVFDVPASEVSTMTRPIEGKPEWGRLFGALFRSRRILEEADMVICVGESEFSAAKTRLHHDRIAYLPNGVDCARFACGDGPRFRARHGIDANAYVVLNISRIDAQKNQMVLIEAFARLLDSDPNAHLVLIGPETQPEYGQKIRDAIQTKQIGHAVSILPGLRNDSPELVDAYHACDTFVLPSTHEPFGIVVLEAWSAGKPVIASRIGGLKTLISDEETGLFFDANESRATEHLTCQLSRMHASKALRSTLAANGQKTAMARYDWQRIHQLQEGLYQMAEQYHAQIKMRAAPTTCRQPQATSTH